MKGHRGFALTEIMLIIGVIAIAMVAVVSTYRVVSTNAKIDKAVKGLGELIESVEAGWGNMQSYNGLTSTLALDRRLVPAILRDERGIQSPWGPVSLGYAGDDRERLSIEIKVPSGACFKFVKSMAPAMYRITAATEGSDGGQAVVFMDNRVLDDDAASRACGSSPTLRMERFEEGFGRRAMWETW